MQSTSCYLHILLFRKIHLRWCNFGVPYILRRNFLPQIIPIWFCKVPAGKPFFDLDHGRRELSPYWHAHSHVLYFRSFGLGGGLQKSGTCRQQLINNKDVARLLQEAARKVAAVPPPPLCVRLRYATLCNYCTQSRVAGKDICVTCTYVQTGCKRHCLQKSGVTLRSHAKLGTGSYRQQKNEQRKPIRNTIHTTGETKTGKPQWKEFKMLQNDLASGLASKVKIADDDDQLDHIDDSLKSLIKLIENDKKLPSGIHAQLQGKRCIFRLSWISLCMNETLLRGRNA